MSAAPTFLDGSNLTPDEAVTQTNLNISRRVSPFPLRPYQFNCISANSIESGLVLSFSLLAVMSQIYSRLDEFQIREPLPYNNIKEKYITPIAEPQMRIVSEWGEMWMR